MEKNAWDDPKWGREDFFLLIQTLPTFWAERISIVSFFFRRHISGFPGPQISKFPDFQVPCTSLATPRGKGYVCGY